jgi:hypothetical protein
VVGVADQQSVAVEVQVVIERVLYLFQQHLMLSQLVLAAKVVEDIQVQTKPVPEEIIVYFQALLLQEVEVVPLGVLL